MKNERFCDCYAKYQRYVIRIAYEWVKNHEAAEDISQTVFMSFYQHMDIVMPGAEKCWLFRCARNAAIDYIRRICRKPELGMDEDVLEGTVNGIQGSAKAVEIEISMYHEDLIKRIMGELKASHPLWYETVYLICVEELSYEEASRWLGVKPGVLRSRIHRARMFVREQFGGEICLES
ncbi:MAG: RNA polymerase sigma factor [Lachnospiraceae bacterium]|nr:RNA polymerase sigma factor [Lachnospiraceae bacterium]